MSTSRGLLLAKTPVGLYRHLLKCISLLPSEARDYYKHKVKQVCVK